MNNPQNIYERIVSILKKKEISAKKMLEDCNCNHIFLQDMKRGKVPSADKLITIANYLEVSSDYLLGLSDILTPADKKNASSETREGNLIYKKLVDIGFIKEGDKITEEHLKVLADVIAPQIDFVHFKLNKGE